ncbi:hypothetical protein GQ53DRAFT_824179 [Thozetella sp. PMI_491]|nr:hypothetical protein GQ53DRAFT_824179 [Thozetella sp. PMI_491]
MGWIPSFAYDNRVVLASLGLTSVALMYTLRLFLEQHRDEAEIKPVQPKTQYITQETEDSLKLGTLETLLGHYNFAIRETAAKILCDRAANDGTSIQVLLLGITRTDPEERLRNLQCLAMIIDHQSLHLINNWKSYTAIVRSLELSRDPDQEVLDDPVYDEWHLRDMSEKIGLTFLEQLLGHFPAEMLVKAKFVEKWLARQNWGKTPDERLLNFARYMAHKAHLNNPVSKVAYIVGRIRESSSGKEALARADLLPRGGSEELGGRLSLMLSLRMGGEEVHERLLARTLDQSAEEQRLRHRHREAMVLNDGTRPFNSEDIIQRDLGSPRM